jgi:N-acetylmuramic acid 6-phosphate etherase
MSEASDKRSEEFLKISGQFKLGALVTESSHPVTANLSEVAKQDITKALDLLFQVDNDVIAKYREFAESGRAEQIKETVVRALENGGKIFFTGCGSTGRLSILLVSIWRDFWQKHSRRRGDESQTKEKTEPPHVGSDEQAEDFENRAFSVMAGGDFALIKSVEGFEDFAAFGKKQIADLGVSDKDVVFAITEGGETSFVIGTAWKGVEVGAKVYFVYNNPDDILCRHVERSREVIQDARIEKINLTTGPMAITGSTRMQATTIQLCVLLTVMEMVVRELVPAPGGYRSSPEEIAPRVYRELVHQMLKLRAPDFLQQLASLVSLEESVYRSGHKNNYYANRLGIDVLTDTTERSPTYCTPPFRKFDDMNAAESWSFLFLPYETGQAWYSILKREMQCVEWSEEEVRELVGDEKFTRTHETIRKITRAELMRFKIGTDGFESRKLNPGDSAIAIYTGTGAQSSSQDNFFTQELRRAESVGARTGLIFMGARKREQEFFAALPDCVSVFIPRSPDTTRLGILRRVTAKIVLNALSTCTMVRLGRVMGNYMIWVVASNLKLIDRATRYIMKLAGLPYEDANRLLFEVVEYVEPRMKADQAYPPVVGMAVLRARDKLTNEQAEKQLNQEFSSTAVQR